MHYFIEGDALHIDEGGAGGRGARAVERHFIAGIRKHAEIAADMKRYSKRLGV